MRDRSKKLVSFSFNFIYTSLQDTVLEKKCLVFLLITISKKILVAMCDRCKKLAYLTQLHLQNASARSVREEKPCLFVDYKGI